MSDAKSRKLQYLLIKQLLEKGSVELILPDGIVLEIGIVQEDKHGILQKSDDYCYVVATRDKKSTLIDSYNLGLQFETDEQNDNFVFESEHMDEEGHVLHLMEVV